MNHTATYSPEDNKLRLYPACRLDSEEYNRVKSAGFKWAPKQELFVAPMWTPEREDLLIEMCGEVGDEDTSLVDRAEQRAERFEDYSDKRAQDADRAHAAVSAIADNIPFGQPILIGHHSEKRARKDAERIENGMRKAVQMWKTSEYWTARAAGALRHAKYKELPAVRYRRIKGIEADKRKQERYKAEAEAALHLWTECAKEQDKDLQMQVAIRLAGTVGRLSMPRKEGDRPDWNLLPDAYTALTNGCPNLYASRTIDEVFAVALAPSTYPANIAHCERWLEHYENRIAYERTMLDEQGGIKADQFEFAIGGRICRRGEWLPILKINKRGGVVQSVTVAGHFASTVSVDEIRDYRPPQEGEAEKAAAIMDKGPMCNYPGEGFKHMTTDEWKRKKMSDVPQSIFHKATEAHGKHRTRATWGGNWTTVAVYLTDSKRIDPPTAPLVPTEPVKFERLRELPAARPTAEKTETAAKFDRLEESLRAGVQVVAAPQLFPTPPELAARMVEMAEIDHLSHVLEPSAGTGSICFQVNRHQIARLAAIEINRGLASNLRNAYGFDPKFFSNRVSNADFLSIDGPDSLVTTLADEDPCEIGSFDAVLMNPPFENGADIKHIQHAMKFLKPGGRLVAICANGPRQNEQLKPTVEQCGGTWEPLPAGTFKEQGTNVNTVLLSLATPFPDPADFGIVADALEVCEDLGISQVLQGSLF